MQLEDALIAYACNAWSSVASCTSSRAIDKKSSKKLMPCDFESSSCTDKRMAGKRKKLVARPLNEAERTFKQRSEREKAKSGPKDSQREREKERGGDKKQEGGKELKKEMKEARSLGRDVRKKFLGYGVFARKVVSYNPQSSLYGIEYEDGDYEELDKLKVQSMLLPDDEDLETPAHDVGKTVVVRRSTQVNNASVSKHVWTIGKHLLRQPQMKKLDAKAESAALAAVDIEAPVPSVDRDDSFDDEYRFMKLVK